MSYTVTNAYAAQTGDDVSTSARVIFDTAAPFDTPGIVQTLDAGAPTTTLTVQRIGSGGTDYLVEWTASDDTGGSGVKSTSVYVSEDGAPWQIWQRQTTDTSGVFTGTAGKRYEFIAASTDNAGNREVPNTPQAVPDDGSGPNLGTTPAVGGTTVDAGTPPAIIQTPSTNPLFLEAMDGIPAATPTRPSEFTSVLAPFSAEVFGTGIPQSNAGIGPMALLVEPGGTVLASGGANRAQLYRFAVDGGHVTAPVATLDAPIFDLAYDSEGGLWATTGGGQLLQLDPVSLAIVARHGESVTQSLAIDPSTGKIYVSTGNGIEIFDRVTGAFTLFSKYRVDDLAFSPTGELWATSWPARGDIVKFDQRGQPQVQVRLDTPADSIAFGRDGTALEGLLFISNHAPLGQTNGAPLVMVDLATLQRVNVASNGPLAEQLAITNDGRVLIAHSHQIDVIAPVTAPMIVATNPPDDTIVALPSNTITVKFDHDMLATEGAVAGSVLNAAHYELKGIAGNVVPVRSLAWDAATRTVALTFDALQPDAYTLTVAAALRSTQGLALPAAYVTDFIAVQDFSALVRLDFLDTRSDRDAGTVSFDVRVTSTTDYDLLGPLMLVLDPARYFRGTPMGATATPGGLWLLDVGAGLTGGRLRPGESTVVRTVTLSNVDGQHGQLGFGLYALPYPNTAPGFVSAPITAATAGTPYSATIAASDPDGAVVTYVLLDAPAGMTLDPVTGALAWSPTAASPAQVSVVLRAYDTRGGHSTQAFAIDVAGGNRAPDVMAVPAVHRIAEGEAFSFTLSASDPDGDALSVFAEDLPAGAFFDNQTATFDWTPAQGQAGEYPPVSFHVTDGVNTVVRTVRFIVTPENAAPQIGGIADRTVRQGDPIRFVLSAVDPEGDRIYFTTPDLPGGAFLDANTGAFEWTPPFDVAGDIVLRFRASDGKLFTERTTTLHVLNVNAPPAFDDLAGLEVLEGETIDFRAFAFDADNPGVIPQDRTSDGSLTAREGSDPTVTYTVSGLPAGATFDTDTAVFRWTPAYAAAGTYTVLFTATDDGDGTGTPAVTTVAVPITCATPTARRSLPRSRTSPSRAARASTSRWASPIRTAIRTRSRPRACRASRRSSRSATAAACCASPPAPRIAVTTS